MRRDQIHVISLTHARSQCVTWIDSFDMLICISIGAPSLYSPNTVTPLPQSRPPLLDGS
jgi:hypothetical protein